MGWIDLIQDRDQWRVLVTMAINLQVPKHGKKFLAEWLLKNGSAPRS
jgi:hypothetical protein